MDFSQRNRDGWKGWKLWLMFNGILLFFVKQAHVKCVGKGQLDPFFILKEQNQTMHVPQKKPIRSQHKKNMDDLLGFSFSFLVSIQQKHNKKGPVLKEPRGVCFFKRESLTCAVLETGGTSKRPKTTPNRGGDLHFFGNGPSSGISVAED